MSISISVKYHFLAILMISLRGYDVTGETPKFAPTSQVRSRVPIIEGVVC
jgi:hypothetical protein